MRGPFERSRGLAARAPEGPLVVARAVPEAPADEDPRLRPLAPERVAALMARARRFLGPAVWLTRPVFHGLEHVPDARPLMFVGNHTVYGVLDVPFLFSELYERKGIFLRSLGDRLHFGIPGWRELVESYGVVNASPAACGRLLDAGECVLVFPGGAREVNKRKGERYELLWKNRLGFARVALQHGATIVPFSAVGIEDAFRILIDGDEVMRSPLGKVLRRLDVRADVLPPLSRPGRPERLYFRFAPPVSVEPFRGRTDDEACWEVRRQTACAIEEGIALLRAERDRERATRPAARLRAKVAGWRSRPPERRDD